MPKRRESEPPCPESVFHIDHYEPCYLSLDHAGPCRSAAAVRASNARRRAKYHASREHEHVHGPRKEGREW